ncbi:MAG: hypothetical protein HC904_08085 [Blastochloris sp.]|nr:hypothetical protein [Blastochloris sp.]
MAGQIHKFREEFASLIETAGIERLVILLDDLDRCLPNTAIETLEAAKLFLFLPRIAFVVAADEGMIEYSVKQHFPDMPIGQAGATYARAYLEKLIQVPFRIPALGDVEIHAYIALLMAEATLGSDNENFANLLNVAREKLRRPWEGGRLTLTELEKFPGAAAELKLGLTLSDQLASVLARGAQGNPRQVKRFLNSLMLREAIAEARGMGHTIKRPVLAKIMLAERFHTEFYSELCLSANLARDGKVKQLATLKAKEGDIDLKNRRQTSDETWEKWAKDEAVKRWAALEPSLEGEDLRPYIFMTRDKKASFGAAGFDALDDLADQLMGPRLSIQSAKVKITALTPEDVSQIFGKLRSRILAEDSFEDTTNDGPSGFPGMVGLASTHETMHLPLIEFLQEAPVGKLGAWAVKHGIRFTGDSEKKWKELLLKWAEQKENRTFSAAVKAVTGPTKESDMGTSSSYGGTPNKSPLVPSWVGDLGVDSAVLVEGGSDASPLPQDAPLGVPVEPLKPKPIPSYAPEDRYTAARSNFTSYAKSGGTGSGAAAGLGRALSSYVKGSGGRSGATRRMTSSQKTASKLGGFIRTVEQDGGAEALREINCSDLIGKDAGEAMERLVDVFCPDGGPVDDSIARQAFQETVLDWAEKDLPAIEQLNPDDWKEFLADFISRSIENKIMTDIGTKGIVVPADARQALAVQRELHSVIRGCVNNGFSERRDSFDRLSDREIPSLMQDVYERAWGFIEEVGGDQ